MSSRSFKLHLGAGSRLLSPSLVTEALKSKMEKITGIPIVTLEYDGTSSIKNEDIIPFLTYARA